MLMLKQKLLLVLMIVSMAFGLNAQITVQGFPYNNPNLNADAVTYGGTPAGEDLTFTFDKIQNWTGTGAKKAALAIQWNDPRETNTMVFGFRWDGEATTEDMIKAVAGADPRLYCLLYPDNGSGFGNCLGGFGWDADEDGSTSLTRKGVLQQPVSPGIYETDDYYFDDFKSEDPDDYSGFGWYQGNWGIFIKDKLSNSFILAPYGISSRKLVDGCMDALNFAVPCMDYKTWKPFVAAPALIPEGAKTEFYVNGIYYKLKSYSQKTVEVVVPFEYQGQPIQKYTNEISIPSTFSDESIKYTVIGIANHAFNNSSVKKIVLPETVKSIGRYAFSNSDLNSINITNAIKSIGEHAFENCFQLADINIPESIEKIEPYTFCSTSIVNINIPASVREVGEFAFAKSRFAQTITLNENLDSIGAGAFLACMRVTELTIPHNVKKIGPQAFFMPALRTIKTTNITPATITDDVFYEDTYTRGELIIPFGYLQAYSNAQGWKNFLTKVESKISVSEGDLFYVDNVYYKITNNAENQKEVIVVHYPVEGVATSSAIEIANTKGYTDAVAIPGVVKYQETDFRVVAVADSAFYGAKAMTSIEIKYTDTLGKNMCSNCSTLVTATLSESLKEIPANTFDYCENLTTLNKLPALETIKTKAFFYCKALQWPEFGDKLTTIESHVFYNCSAFTSIVYPQNVDIVPDYIFDYCENLTSVTLGENVTTVGDYAFANCPKLNSINFPAKVTELPYRVFYKSGLTTVVIPSTVKVLGNGAFASSSKLSNVTLHENLTIETSVFESCTSLVSIKLPESLIKIPASTFSGCNKLKTVQMSKDVISIGNSAFKRTALESFEFPELLTTVGSNCFEGCSLLTSVKINSKVKNLPVRLFAETKLDKLVIPKNVESVESNLIYNCKNPNVEVWLCNTTPVKITSNRTFMVSNNVFAQLNVPYGTTDTYKTVNSYWTKNTYKEYTPVFSGINIGNAETTDNTALLRGTTKLTYNDTILPQEFETVNNAAFLTVENATYSVTAEYRKAKATDEYKSVNATYSNGTYSATVSELEIDTNYEYLWKLSNGSDEVYSELANFKTSGVKPLKDYTNGFFILNEDWFGTSNSSINFVTDEDDIHYRVFRKENKGSTLGVTSQYGTIYGDKMFIISKQNAMGAGRAGGRIIVADAKSMKLISSINEIADADGRAFIGVSDKLGYIGTTNGIYLFDIKNYIVGPQIQGTGSTTGDLYTNQIGDMVRYQDYVFAAKQGEGILVIDTKSNKLVRKIELPNISTVFVTYAGGVYASDNNGFYSIDPYTFEMEFFSVPNGNGAIASWGAWQPAKITSDLNENSIYYATGSSWSANRVNKYNFDTKTFTKNFVQFSESIYGNITTNPTTGELVTTTNVSFSDDNKLHFINAETGDILRTLPLEKYYWFPSMEIYPDIELPVISGLENIKLDIDSDQKFDTPLLDLVSDADNYNVSISAEIKNIVGQKFMDAKIVNGNLVIKPKDDGEASFDFVVNSNGKYVTKNVIVSVIRSTGVDKTFATQSDITCNNGILKIHANTNGFVQIFNISGQMIMSTEVVEGNNEFNLSNLTDGVYVVKYNNTIKKIVK